MSLTGRPTKADQAERTRLIAAQAERAERLNRVEAGKLVPAVDVKAEWLDISIQIRTRLLAIPARIAALHPNNPKLIADLERELHDALNTIANDDL
jgi:phage terminase Nu1 subunit (DNA packaging protein)